MSLEYEPSSELVKALRWALAQAYDAGARADRQRWQVPPGTHMSREIGILLPNNQRQHRTLHIQKDVLPYASC